MRTDEPTTRREATGPLGKLPDLPASAYPPGATTLPDGPRIEPRELAPGEMLEEGTLPPGSAPRRLVGPGRSA